MPLRIEDYAIIGDCSSAALVGRDGSIDWLCLPRYDSPACFAAILGSPDNGRWRIAPKHEVCETRRRYRPNTLILETTFVTDEGEVMVIDMMPIRSDAPRLVRTVVGVRGRVQMCTEIIIRFDYGSAVPWVRAIDHQGIHAIAGPDALEFRTGVPLEGKDLTTVGEFTIEAGQSIPFVLSYFPSFNDAPPRIDAARAIERTTAFWEEWSARCLYEGPWREAVVRSLITLKALTDARTGGIVAAATTSLPERIGGVRNWDYRFCWLRDATFTLYSLMHAGYEEEAVAWRQWLLRAIAGSAEQMQILYGLAGERRLTEIELPWLAGYEGSKPVRVGNLASEQLQLDVYGEVMDVMHQCQRLNMQDDVAWNMQRSLMGELVKIWNEPDDGIWEVRGPRRHFTHSKMMAWVALDRAIKTVERYKMEGPVDKWCEVRKRIFDQVCSEGFDPKIGSFVQSYGSKHLDASLLMMPLVGFLPATDPRVVGTVAAIEKNLMRDGFVLRYSSDEDVDGLPKGEGAFLPCTFWLADNWALSGREDDARKLFERLLSVTSDLGLLAEEYDPKAKRMLGNFPQAFSHVSLVNTAFNLSHEAGPAKHRRET